MNPAWKESPMRTPRIFWMPGAVLIAAIALGLIFSPKAAMAAAQDVLLGKAQALVTTKFVLQVKMEGSGEREIEGEITCLAIDEKGLVLCSNTELGGYVSLLSKMMGGQDFNISATPTELRVSPENGTESFPARLLTRDSDRDLAWVQIEGAADKKFPFLDLSQSAPLAQGDKFYVVRRLDKFFDRVPMITEGTVGAVTSKPRALWVPSFPVGGGFGLPVFTPAGTLVGITVLQLPEADERMRRQLGSPLGFLGEASRMQDMASGLILPAAEAHKATQLARELIASDQAEEPE